MSAGVVVRAAEVTRHEAGPGASLRFLVETGNGAPGLVRRLADLAAGGRIEGRSAAADELWFVLGGSGELEAGGQPPVPLHPDRGVLIPAGMPFAVRAAAATGLSLDMVALPAAPGAAVPPLTGTGPAVSDFADCAIETTGDRQFRVVFGPGRGCSAATQFVGEIPPGGRPTTAIPTTR